MMRPYFNIATVIFAAAIIVATSLVVILLRNPATHANLEDPEFYDRTELAYLDREYVYTGFGHGAAFIEVAGADPRDAGRALYVRAGCIGCHGAYAEGATVAGALWDIDADEFPDFLRDVRDGPDGMPSYSEAMLSEEALRLIVAFLEAAESEGLAVGVTTTTTTRPPLPATTTTVVAQSTTTQPGATTEPPGSTTTGPPDAALALDAPALTGIVVDGDPTDWDAIAGLELTLEPIVGEDDASKEAFVKVAHDDEFIYVLFGVEDDFNWSELDPRFGGAPAVMWPVEEAAGPHMGGDDPSGYPALGIVDIWYWRLECPIGVEQGGAVHGPGNGDPGNDGTCNFDDEWASEPEVHEDDLGDGAENSLLGVFSHSNPLEDANGTWYFEMRRPLQTGDPLDAQFTVGGVSRLALAYWDPDAGQNGWGRDDHVQSSNLGWIEVRLIE